MAKKTDIPLPRANSQASKFGSKIKKSDIKVKRTDIPLPQKNSQASKFGESGQDRKKKTLKEKVKQQADWLWRDIKSDFLPTAERQKVQDQIAKEKKAEYNRKGGFKNDKVGQFYTGLGEGFVNSSLPGTAYSIVKGKKLSDKMEKGGKIIKPPTKNAAKSRKIGNIAGEMLGYATGYGAAEKATAKAAGKVLATKAGKKATEKAVASKVGKKIGEEATKQVLKSATKNAIADATVGTAMDLGLARGEGKKGKELAKDMAVNAGINAVTGGVMEAIPVVKALKGSKKAVKKELPKVVKQAVKDEVTPKVELPKTVAKQAENVKIDPKMELPTANSVKNSVEISGKTHNAKKIELIPKSAADVGPQPTAVDLESTLNQSISNSQNNVKLKDLGADVARPNQAFKDAEIAPPIKQAAEEVKVTPSGKETKVGGFDVVGKQNLGIVNPDIKTVQEAMENASGKFDKFYKATVNQQHEIDRLSKASGDRRAADAVQATRSASGTAEYIFSNHLVDPKGNVIDDRSFREVFEPISKKSKEFNEYAQHLNNLARWEQGKPLDVNVTPDMSKKRISEIIKDNPEFPQLNDNKNSFWRKFTHAWLVDTGRMNEQAWKAMNDMYPNYVPAFMKDKGVRVGGSKFAVDAGTKGAKAGTTLDRVPIEDAMMEQVQQLVKSTRKNDMYLSVIDTLRKDPENLKRFGIVKSKTSPISGTDIDEFLSLADQEALKEVNSKVYTISAMENGQKVTAYINKDLAEAFGKLDNLIGSPQMQMFANIGKSITNPLKAGITGYNPLFAISNAARDIPTALIQSEYGMLKTTKNMFRSIKEIATNGEMWQRYLALGGKSSGYIKAHKGFEKNLSLSKNPIRNIWEGMKTVLGSVGEATESIPRFAEFMSSMEAHGDAARALTESAEVTVNFSRAGEVTKFLDAWTLYLNAAVQGIDKFVRTAKAHPVRTAARSLEVVGVPYALLMVNNWSNPHYQDLNDRTKQNYFCIPNLAGEIDESGNAKTFIKIPLNREYGSIFASSMDVIAGYLSGEANPWNGYAETLKTNFLPPNPLTDNVLSPLVLNLPQNKDFAGRSIVPKNLENVSPQLQYDYSTSGLAKGISNVANNLRIPSDTLKSPMKVDYLLDSFGGYLGQVGQAVTDPQLQGIGERIKGATIDPFVNRFTADPRFSSGVVSDFYDNKENAERAANDEKILTGGKGQAYVENKTYSAIQQELSDLSKQEREILSSGLSKAEKDRQIKAIREQKNEIARSASQRVQSAVSAYQDNPEYETQMNTQQKQSYEKKFKKLGISKEDYAEAKSIVQGYDSNVAKAYALLESGKSPELAKAMTSQSAIDDATELKKRGVTLDDVNTAKTIVKDSGYKKSIGQAYALLDNGQSVDVASVMTSERAVQRATWLKQSGVTPDQLDQVAEVIDANGNGSYSKDEIVSFFNQSSGFSTAQKRAIFLALSTAKHSPY
nr:MAG TPA: Large polyvalent protein associated domain 38 [Caudoviricetes sp.]